MSRTFSTPILPSVFEEKEDQIHLLGPQIKDWWLGFKLNFFAGFLCEPLMCLKQNAYFCQKQLAFGCQLGFGSHSQMLPNNHFSSFFYGSLMWASFGHEEQRYSFNDFQSFHHFDHVNACPNMCSLAKIHTILVTLKRAPCGTT